MEVQINVKGITGIIFKFKANEKPPLTKARSVVESAIGLDWSVESLGEIDFIARPSKIDLSLGDCWNVTYKLQENHELERAEPDFIFEVGKEDDRSFLGACDAHIPATGTYRWSLNSVHAYGAWEKVNLPPGGKRMGAGIRVGHIDTGYTKHPEFWEAEPGQGGRLRNDLGWNFIEGKEDALDPLIGGGINNPGHGTSTGTLIISSEKGKLLGTAPRAELVPMRVTNTVIMNSGDTLIPAMDYSITVGCHVISISLGGIRGTIYSYNALDRLVAAGVIPVAAAGQVAGDVAFPGRFPQPICCTASNYDNKIWRKASRGKEIDIAAPGESVWNPQAKTGDVDQHCGSSFSTAIVAGAAASWLSHWTREVIIRRFGIHQIGKLFLYILANHGRDVPQGWDTENDGWGIMNMHKLVAYDINTVTQEKLNTFWQQRSPENIATSLGLFCLNLSDLDPDALKETLCQLLNQVENWANYCDEVRLHIETNQSFRELFKDCVKAPQQQRKAILDEMRGILLKDASHGLSRCLV